jgi:hypothetical protein
MEVAPPPEPGSRIQELGDRLIVRFRPHRSWGEIAFFTFWLTLWTVGGFAVFYALPGEDPSGRAFMLLWLCGWVFGECSVIVIIAWQLAGRELLTVTPQYLEVRQEIRRFARTKRYDVGLVHDVRAARVPSDEDEKPRKDFCLQVSYNEKKVPVGEGMGEREAEYIASTVLARIRPRARWGDEGDADPYDAKEEHFPSAGDDDRAAARAYADPEYPPTSTPGHHGVVAVGGTLIALVVLGGAAIALLQERDGPQPPPPTPETSAQAFSDPPPPIRGGSASMPPSAQEFSDPRRYASATTRYSLTSAKTKVLGRPDCGKHVAWTKWACSVTAKAMLGPFAGRALTYRCFPSYSEQPGGQSAVLVINCGPENPPPITAGS